MTRRFLAMAWRLWTPAAIVVLAAGRGWSEEVKPAVDSSAGKLVQAALASELSGDNQQRQTLLRQAVEQSPGDAAAHWQLGQVLVKGKWQSPAEIETAAQNDKLLAEYRQRRDQCTLTLPDQLALARWCRKNHLDEEQRLHWMIILQLAPGNGEAMQALGLRPYFGMLLTGAQIEQLKAQQQKVVKAAEQWRPLVAQWRRSADGPDSAILPAMREQIAKIDDAATMVALEAELWRQVAPKPPARLYHDMLRAMIPVLGENPRPAVSESLARYAAFSEFDDVRSAAIAELKRRPLDHYVPLLLSGLQSPIEADVRCTLGAAGNLITNYTFFQEGALSNVSSSLIVAPSASGLGPATADVSITPGTGTVEFSPGQKERLLRTDPGRVAAAYAQARADAASASQEIANANAANAIAAAANWEVNAMASRALAARRQAAMRDTVDRANDTIAARNAQIVAVLSPTTGKDLGEKPMRWWSWWWQDYNEMYEIDGEASGSAKPEYHYDNRVEYDGDTPTYSPNPAIAGHGPTTIYEPPPVTATGGRQSCFAADTKVWTLTGRQPIEKIKPGDRVLAQNVETGELAYKPVLMVTLRPPGQRLKVALGKDSITATPGHPFWVAGEGWLLTKQLAAGKRVHTLSGSAPIGSIEVQQSDPSYLGSAYNLIVADYGTFFVGDTGILVHDNTPRQPTAAVLPGMPRQSVAP